MYHLLGCSFGAGWGRRAFSGNSKISKTSSDWVLFRKPWSKAIWF